jgi:UDP-glucose 4-epimerase
MTKRNIFLVGGAGYIGSAAAQTLLEAGHKVTVYDSLSTGHREAVPEEARFIHADLADTDCLKKTLHSERYDAVMHFAAFIEAGESFVFSSTAAVYASSDKPLSEESPLGPANVYGQTKLMIEQALEWYRQIYGLHYAALRYFNAAGALSDRGEAHQPETHLIPIVLQVALGQREQLQIYGTDYPTPDGTCIRDYIHIADLIDAHLLALDALDIEDKLIYNLGNGAGYSVREVIETARRITEHPIPATETARRPGDAPRLVASADKIRRELGWQPQQPQLEKIIASAWEWHRSHPHGYD